MRWIGAALFQRRRAPIPTARSARITHPEIHVIPRAIDAALGRDRFAIFGDDYETPDGTCLRDYVHVTDLAGPRPGARVAARAAGASAAYNLGTGRPISVREVIDCGRAGHGPAGAGRRGAAAARRPGGPLRLERQDPARRSAGRPQFEDLDVIVETAWRWRERTPRIRDRQSAQGCDEPRQVDGTTD